jgi:hypothetical protein
MNLGAIDQDNYIWTSTGAGVTWTPQAAAGARQWTSIASSNDGMTLAAVAYFGDIYTSADGGVTCTFSSAKGALGNNGNWFGLASA